MPPKKPVLAVTAAQMALRHWESEPFRVECRLRRAALPSCAIYHSHWSPLSSTRTTRGHSTKRPPNSCTRCPLITYALKPHETLPPMADKIEEYIGHQIVKLSTYLRAMEDPASQYLFLLGIESTLRSLVWHALSYRAHAGPASTTWSKVGLRGGREQPMISIREITEYAPP